ncbi:hypothetical protein BDV59DRAFT_22133 [Aspergillus ambiguus]|uniref:uncharacterized protein n=1 Tax=Aspergillus ambiguus TaxID=176160 RepID=UPI003CCDA3DA
MACRSQAIYSCFMCGVGTWSRVHSARQWYRIYFTPILQNAETRPKIQRFAEYLRKQRGLGAFVHVNPLRIPELDVYISQARVARQWDRLHGRYPPPSPPRLLLPLDIQMLIVDELEDVEDIAKATDALQWNFTDGYWKTRIPKDIIFEYSAIQNDDLQWNRLFYIIQHLLRESHGLRKRQQILNFLD